jgi:hypothetical protein
VKSITFEEFVPSIQLSATPYHKCTWGADVEVPFGLYIARAEAAFNQTKDYENNMYIPNPGFNWVAGIERSFWDITTILQYIGYFTLDFISFEELPPPQTVDEVIIRELTGFNRKIFYQQEITNHALSLTLNRSFNYETITIEAMGYYNITSEEWFIRPKLGWKMNDHLETGIGGFYSKGPDESLYYYASDVLNGAFVEMKVNF